MTRFAAALFAATALAPAAAAPVPKHLMTTSPPIYFPTAAGAEWVYENRRPLFVSDVRSRDGVTVVTVMGRANTGPFVHEVIEIAKAGLFRTRSGNSKFDPPVVLLRTPLKVGNEWTYAYDETNVVVTIAAVETVEVPAGTFECLRVEAVFTTAGTETKYVEWYAPNVGLVRQAGSGGHYTMLLKSFTPGRG